MSKADFLLKKAEYFEKLTKSSDNLFNSLAANWLEGAGRTGNAGTVGNTVNNLGGFIGGTFDTGGTPNNKVKIDNFGVGPGSNKIDYKSVKDVIHDAHEIASDAIDILTHDGVQQYDYRNRNQQNQNVKKEDYLDGYGNTFNNIKVTYKKQVAQQPTQPQQQVAQQQPNQTQQPLQQPNQTQQAQQQPQQQTQQVAQQPNQNQQLTPQQKQQLAQKQKQQQVKPAFNRFDYLIEKYGNTF